MRFAEDNGNQCTDNAEGHNIEPTQHSISNGYQIYNSSSQRNNSCTRDFQSYRQCGTPTLQTSFGYGGFCVDSTPVATSVLHSPATTARPRMQLQYSVPLAPFEQHPPDAFPMKQTQSPLRWYASPSAGSGFQNAPPPPRAYVSGYPAVRHPQRIERFSRRSVPPKKPPLPTASGPSAVRFIPPTWMPPHSPTHIDAFTSVPLPPSTRRWSDTHAHQPLNRPLMFPTMQQRRSASLQPQRRVLPPQELVHESSGTFPGSYRCDPPTVASVPRAVRPQWSSIPVPRLSSRLLSNKKENQLTDGGGTGSTEEMSVLSVLKKTLTPLSRFLMMRNTDSTARIDPAANGSTCSNENSLRESNSTDLSDLSSHTTGNSSKFVQSHETSTFRSPTNAEVIPNFVSSEVDFFNSLEVEVDEAHQVWSDVNPSLDSKPKEIGTIQQQMKMDSTDRKSSVEGNGRQRHQFPISVQPVYLSQPLNEGHLITAEMFSQLPTQKRCLADEQQGLEPIGSSIWEQLEKRDDHKIEDQHSAMIVPARICKVESTADVLPQVPTVVINQSRVLSNEPVEFGEALPTLLGQKREENCKSTPSVIFDSTGTQTEDVKLSESLIKVEVKTEDEEERSFSSVLCAHCELIYHKSDQGIQVSDEEFELLELLEERNQWSVEKETILNQMAIKETHILKLEKTIRNLEGQVLSNLRRACQAEEALNDEKTMKRRSKQKRAEATSIVVLPSPIELSVVESVRVNSSSVYSLDHEMDQCPNLDQCPDTVEDPINPDSPFGVLESALVPKLAIHTDPLSETNDNKFFIDASQNLVIICESFQFVNHFNF